VYSAISFWYQASSFWPVCSSVSAALLLSGKSNTAS
jgi:hypothetical protein